MWRFDRDGTNQETPAFGDPLRQPSHVSDAHKDAPAETPHHSMQATCKHSMQAARRRSRDSRFNAPETKDGKMTTNLVNWSDAPKKNGIENGMSLFFFFFCFFVFFFGFLQKSTEKDRQCRSCRCCNLQHHSPPTTRDCDSESEFTACSDARRKGRLGPHTRVRMRIALKYLAHTTSQS